MGLKPSTITTLISALSYFHHINRWKNPCKSFIIQKLLYSIRKSRVPDKRQGFTLPLLKLMIKALKEVTSCAYVRLLIKTMFLTAFYALLRQGEISVTRTGANNIVKLENVAFQYEAGKLTQATITLDHFKHSQGNIANIILSCSKSKSLCPVRTLFKYVKALSIRKGPLFCFQNGAPVNSSFFRRILGSCVRKCQLDPRKYTTHSFRIGGATLAYDRHFSNAQIQQLGRWSSQAFTKYLRPSLNHSVVT